MLLLSSLKPTASNRPPACACRYCYLQQPSEADVTDFILDQFDLLHRTYLEDRKLIPPGVCRAGQGLDWEPPPPVARRSNSASPRLLLALLSVSQSSGAAVILILPTNPFSPLCDSRQAAWWKFLLLSWTPTRWARCAASTRASPCRASRACAPPSSATARAWS